MSENAPVEDRTYHAQVRVRADKCEPLRRIWRYVGYDEPNYTYTPRGRELLAKLGGMTDAPYFIRCHFLLCSGDGTGRPKWGSTNVYTEDANGEPVYSWTIIDQILDAIVAAGCIPFVELGFTPEALTTAPPGTAYDDPRDGGWRFPPKDYGRWLELVRTLAEHCRDRYGLRQVSRWYWELWNEPDIRYWAGTVPGYCRLYDYTVAGLLAAIPQARVGGPATTSPGGANAGAFLRAFLEHCVVGANAVSGGRGTRLDFVSFHTKGGSAPRDPHAHKQTPTIHALIRHVVAGLDIVATLPELWDREIILSECDPDGWAAGSIKDNPNLFYRNTEYYASYVASAACKLLDMGHIRAGVTDRLQVDAMLTWAFEFEGRGYFEGLRTLSTNGIDKPVLNALRLLAWLGSTRCALESSAWRTPMSGHGDEVVDAPDLSGLAAVDQMGSAQIVLVSHHDDWDITGSTEVSVDVAGLEPGAMYTVESYAVDKASANSHTAWQHMGRPAQPTEEQRRALVAASQLKSEALGRFKAKGGRIQFSLSCQSHSVTLLVVSPDRA